ncbi:MAG: hypothetical protein ACREIA_00785 [Opitutaceae bacterium]
MKAALFIVGVIVTLVLFAGIFVLKIRFVELEVPVGFRGLIRINQAAGAGGIEREVLRSVIRIPASGEVKVDSLAVFRRLHRLTARYADGRPIEVVLPGDEFPGDALWQMDTPPTDNIYYFVGTREELISFISEKQKQLYRAK